VPFGALRGHGGRRRFAAKLQALASRQLDSVPFPYSFTLDLSVATPALEGVIARTKEVLTRSGCRITEPAPQSIRFEPPWPRRGAAPAGSSALLEIDVGWLDFAVSRGVTLVSLRCRVSILVLGFSVGLGLLAALAVLMAAIPNLAGVLIGLTLAIVPWAVARRRVDTWFARLCRTVDEAMSAG